MKSLVNVPDDFDGWWKAPGNWIEEPNIRRGGWSGMMTLSIDDVLYFIKKQSNHCYRSLRHPFGQPTTAREYSNILRLTALGIRVPQVIFHGTRKTGEGFLGLLVTRELQGFKALDDLAHLSAAYKTQVAIAVGQAAACMHRARLRHACFYGKHIMARWPDEAPETRPEIALIDLEKMRPAFSVKRAAAPDLDQLQRHQCLWNDADWQQLLAAHRAILRP